MTNKSIEQWRESNKKLSQKNTYFKQQLPIVKRKIDRLEQKLEDQKEEYEKELAEVRGELAKEVHLHDITSRNFQMLSAMKMEELLGYVYGGSGL